MGFEFFDALWRRCRVVAIGSETDASPQSWATDPVPGDIHGVEEILERMRRGADRAATDSVVGTLLRRGSGDD